MQASTAYALVIAVILVACVPLYVTLRASTKRINEELARSKG